MFIVKVLVLFILIPFCAWSQDRSNYTVEITAADLSFRDDANFTSSTHIKSHLTTGDEAQILKVQKFNNGSGLQIRMSSGSNKGKIGWVYMSKTPEKRLLKLKNNDADIEISEENFFDQLEIVNQNIDIQNKNLAGAKVSAKPTPQESLDDVWVKIYNGHYTIDSDNDDGGENFPVIRKWIDSDGLIQTDRIFIPRNYDRLLGVLDTKRNGLDITNNSCNEEGFNKVEFLSQAQVGVDGATAGCEFLNLDAGQWDDVQMMNCIDNIRKRIHPENISTKINSSSKNSHKKAITELFKLPEAEREFIGAVLTTFGEARSQSDEEVYLILKTFENRKEMAKKRCQNADILDVVLVPYHYSMWNYKGKRKNKRTNKTYYALENWRNALTLEEEEKPWNSQSGERYHLKRMAINYKKYKQKEFKTSNPKLVEDITHYRTRAMGDWREGWGPVTDSIPTIKVNGMEIGKLNPDSGQGQDHVAHYFFTPDAKRGYTYVQHSLRKGVRPCN